MSWLQIHLIGPIFSSFSPQSHGNEPHTSENLDPIVQFFCFGAENPTPCRTLSPIEPTI